MQSQIKEQVSNNLGDQLVGNINEETAIINGHVTRALIDTGYVSVDIS